MEQGTKEAPEKELPAEDLWAQAQKDHASTPAGESVVVTEVAPKVAPGAAPDPLAGLPESTRKLVEQIQAKTAEQDATLKAVGQKLATAHGTIGNLTKRLNDSLVTLNQMKPTIDAVEATKQIEAKALVATKAARRKELREQLSDFPVVIDYLDEMMPPEAEVKLEPEAKPEARTAAPAAELPADREARLIAERELSDLHPKWIEIVRSEAFRSWREAQPAAIQALGASDNPADAAEMLDAYKQQKSDAAQVAQVEADRQARLRRGESVPGRGTAQQGEVPTPDALWEQAKREHAKAKAA